LSCRPFAWGDVDNGDHAIGLPSHVEDGRIWCNALASQFNSTIFCCIAKINNCSLACCGSGGNEKGLILISDYEYLEGKSISFIGPFQDGLQFLAPNQRKYFYLGPLNLIERKLRAKDIEILARYKDGGRKNQEDLTIISLALIESEYSLTHSINDCLRKSN
jgi:hypothetical protein